VAVVADIAADEGVDVLVAGGAAPSAAAARGGGGWWMWRPGLRAKARAYLSPESWYSFSASSPALVLACSYKMSPQL
jgi:hypothetical protein